MSDATIEQVRYTCAAHLNKKVIEKSIDVIGIDTEAYTDGQMFMLTTSLGDVFRREEIPACFFNRKYRGSHFVAYNLKYDEGAILQFLTKENLRILWETGKCEQDDYIVRSIPKKMLSISKSTHAVHFWDMYNYYTGSLRSNARKYLGMDKLDSDVECYTPEYVSENWDEIACYCFMDSFLVDRLAKLLIEKFEDFGVYPRKLYSTAYMSYQYFSKKCDYPTVKNLWENDRGVLDYAMRSYNGGKFEVTEKGSGYFYEYDIVSAYPAEIALLPSIDHCRVIWSKKYRRYAKFAFLLCDINIPYDTFSPVAVKMGTLNIYPVGHYQKVITLPEYDYLISVGCDLEILNACWIHVDDVSYPFAEEIKRLTALKHIYKETGKRLDYITVKIFMNSLYGKFCQLIKQSDGWKASSCWNPIYASYITAKTRIKVSQMQQSYPEIIAVHTDSLISKKPLPIETSKELGCFDFECEGNGVVIGSGIYQIGTKSKYRGFNLDIPLMDLINVASKTIPIKEVHAHTWSEVAFRQWDVTEINHFEEITKELSCNFDHKRLWENDVKNFRQLLRRNVTSEAIDALFLGIIK